MPTMLRRLALGAALALASAAGQAAVLGAANFDETYVLPLGPGAEPPPPPAYLVLHLGYSATVGALEDPGTMIFDGVQLLAGATPLIVTLSSAAQDAQWPAFLARLTNGLDDEVRINIIGNEGGGMGYATLESDAVASLGAPLPGPDLHGALITGIELQVDTLTINPVSAFSTEAWHIAGQLRVLGEYPAPVPLPGAAWLLAAALPWLARGMRRRGRD